MTAIDAPVVVTGADTPAGAATAFALDGVAKVIVLCGTDGEALGALANKLSGRVAIFHGDVTGAPGAAALAEFVEEQFAPRES
ncbi:MAG: hypothetical protein JWL83_3040 [Actinomycetia bacterium]|nr:hypothetical protein [Actinomycetes bacterium]